MWAGYSQACDESGQEVDGVHREKPLRPEDEIGGRWKTLYPSHRGSLSSRGITRTQSGFVMVDKMRGARLRPGLIGQECGGLSVSDSKASRPKPG